jgi:hypothetical protein
MARDTQINLRVSADEAADLSQAATDCDMTLSEWARIVLLYTAGRPIAEHLDRAAVARGKLVNAAIGKAVKGKLR